MEKITLVDDELCEKFASPTLAYPFSSDLFYINKKLYYKPFQFKETYFNIDKLKKIIENGFKDRLTNSYSKNYLYEYLNSLITSNKDFVLIFFDVDDFKRINTQLGHFKADEILNALGKVLNRCYSKNSDFIFRFGGDEFIIISENCDLEKQRKTCLNVNKNFHSECKVTCSFGICKYDKAKSFEDNLSNLDHLLKQDKKTKAKRGQ